MNKFWKYISTLGPIGYSYFPGTLASFITIIFIYKLRFLESNLFILISFLVFFVSVYSTKKGIFFFKEKDPSQIVIDEVVGCFAIFCFVPISIKTVIIGFILFRFFDITKLFGVRQFEKINGYWGVVLDDIFAGILSNIVLQLLCIYHFLEL